MIYDGILSRLLNADLAQMEKALRKQLGKKTKAIELNLNALKAGSEFAAQNLEKRDPFWIEPMDKTGGMILVEGNAAAALGSVMAGCTVVAWYPITPSSSLCRGHHRLHAEVPHGQGDRQGDVRDRAGRGRDRGARDGAGRRLGGRAVR